MPKLGTTKGFCNFELKHFHFDKAILIYKRVPVIYKPSNICDTRIVNYSAKFSYLEL